MMSYNLSVIPECLLSGISSYFLKNKKVEIPHARAVRAALAMRATLAMRAALAM